VEFDLGVLDRIALLNLLPTEEVQSNFLTLKSLRVFREELVISPEEAKKFGLVELDNGRIQWNTAKERPKRFLVDDSVLAVIRRRLKGLDETGRLLEQQMPLYERFLLTEA